MKTLEVLLRDDVQGIGDCGDIVRVSAGYARNFLLPRRLAVQATPDSIAMMQRRRERMDADRAARNAEYERLVELLGALTLTTSERADENGHLFGSVSAGAVAELLAGAGHRMEERQVRLAAPIKSVGTHEVPVHVHGDHTAMVKLVVEAAAE